MVSLFVMTSVFVSAPTEIGSGTGANGTSGPKNLDGNRLMVFALLL